MKTVSLERAADFKQSGEDMAYDFYHRMRSYKPDWPLVLFVSLGFWSAEQVERFEKRYRGQ